MSKAVSPLRAAWAAYNRSLQTQPLLTKAGTSVTGFIVGDTVAQAAVNGNFKDQDWVRTARFATYGALVHGPTCHYFYRWLDTAVVGTGARQVLTKVAADQLLFTPFGISAFYATITALEGRASETPQVLREKFVKTILAGYCVWPAVHVVNFRFVPGELRVLFVNCVQVPFLRVATLAVCILCLRARGGKKNAVGTFDSILVDSILSDNIQPFEPG